MTTDGLLHISDFDWGTVGRYLQWLELYLDMTQVRSDDVNSFALAKYGFVRLETRKRKTAKVLGENMRKLEVFVGNAKDELEESELAVIRSWYKDLSRAQNLCEGHANTAQELGRAFANSQSYYRDMEADNDDLPF